MKKTILLLVILGVLLTSFVSAGWFADNFYKADFTGASVFQAPKPINGKCVFYSEQSPTFTSQGVKHECKSVNLISNVGCTTDLKGGSCGVEFKATEGETISWTSPTCKGVAATKIIKGRNNYYANFYNCGSSTPVSKKCKEGEIRLSNIVEGHAFGAEICRKGTFIPAKIAN